MVAQAETHTDDFEQEALSHLPSLMAVALRLTRSRPEAEDLVQDTYVKALRARAQYQVGTRLKAWLLCILKNTFINRYRRGGLEKSVLEGPSADPLADGWIGVSSMRAMRDPESLALAPSIHAEILAAVDSLPEEFRLAVLLVDVEELSYKEVAETLGCPIGTVMSRLHRGRRLLKQQLLGHARAAGIVKPESDVGGPGEQEHSPVSMASYRERKRGNG